MSYFDELRREPWRHDFLDMMRHIERSLGESCASTSSPRPRIGDSASRNDEVVGLRWGEQENRRNIHTRVSFGQDPWMAFPGANVERVAFRRAPASASRDDEADPTLPPERIHIVSRFLGLLGAQGPLPLHITEETRDWLFHSEPAFAHFLDIFNNRFIQLFFRAHADARPIFQNDRPDCDRFRDYVGSVIGVGSRAFDGLANLPPEVRLYAGLLGPKAKSASRLRQIIAGMFGVRAEIDEFCGSWLAFEAQDTSLLGARNSALGVDCMIGAAYFSVQDKIRVRIFVSSMEQYRRFLPDGPDSDRLVDLMFFYVGDELDWDVELAVPARRAPPIRLDKEERPGDGARLGWTSWMGRNPRPPKFLADARFHPTNRKRHEREKGKAQQMQRQGEGART